MDRTKKKTFLTSKIATAVLLGFFPVFLWFVTELGHVQDAGNLFHFTANRFGVMLFGTLLIAALFWFLAFLVRRVWISGLITGLIFFALSCVEYYKYCISGAHLLISDLLLTKNVSDLAHFAKLSFNPLLFGCGLLLAAYILLLVLTEYRVNIRLSLRSLASAAIAAFTVVCIAVPTFFLPVCEAFGIDDSYSYNAFSEEDRFGNNNLIGNLAVSLNQELRSKVQRPDNYSESAIKKIVIPAQAQPQELKPNIIFIMSESFADFRVLDQLEIDPEIYADFDRAKAQSFVGASVVPTFGGNTVRTEFELMFGLPVKSLNNAAVPHLLLSDDTKQDTFAEIYKSLGYHTTYIHPYSASFYDRDSAYAEYGFDDLLFQDNLTVPIQRYRDYIDDATVYQQLLAQMKASSGPDYIHLTTMQNHQPYGSAEGEEKGELDELTNYLSGVQKSGEALLQLLETLKNFDEPVILCFIGDHFPYFSPQSPVYDLAGVSTENCALLYEQTYLVWTNQPELFDASLLPEEKVSSFYLPHLLYRYAGLPVDSFVDTILSELAECPVYSISENANGKEELLDLLTYDRTLGDGYSEEKQ